MIDLIIIMIALLVTYITGTISERRHLGRLKTSEEALLSSPFVTDSFTAKNADIERTEFISAGCVIAADRFKNFLAGLRNIFGGSVSSYESLTERARRQAIVTMREQAKDADMVVKARIQLCELGKGRVEAIAYGTAIYLRKPTSAQV